MSSKEALQRFQHYIQQIEDDSLELKNKLSTEPCCSNPPILHFNEDLDLLLRNNLKLESEITALVNRDLVLLPDDQDILLNIAKEKSQKSLLNTAQALSLQKNVNEKLEIEKQNLEELIRNAETVKGNLDEMIQNTTQEDYAASLKYKYTKYGKLFQELREELSWYLNTRFPATDEASLSLEDILEAVTKKFLDDPNEAYVDFDNRAKEEHLTFLIRSNLIMRHPNDINKYKLVDFRRN